jgi:hypothetical protein
VVTQLRDLLAAEDSAEVADEDEDRGAVSPLVAQPMRTALGIEDREIADSRRKIGHG